MTGNTDKQLRAIQSELRERMMKLDRASPQFWANVSAEMLRSRDKLVLLLGHEDVDVKCVEDTPGNFSLVFDFGQEGNAAQ